LWRRLPWIMMALCLAAFSYGVQSIPSAPADQFGLLASASPLYPTSILLAALTFVVAMRLRNRAAAVIAIVLIIMTERLPRALSTEAPMYAWTYKHLGVVDYIQTHEALARGTDIYNSWPGLFAFTAWISDLTELSPHTLAHWITPFIHLTMAGLSYAAARAWRLSPDQALTAAFLVVTLNWVEQDYFAPQAAAMILTTAILIVFGLSRDRPVATVLALVMFAAATVTHQLTPFWVLLMAGLLIVGKQLKPWWIAVPMAAILIGYFLFNFDMVSHYTLLSTDVVDNAQGRLPGPMPAGQIFTSTVMRVLSVSIWLATLATLIYRMRKGKPFWALGVLALSPILILGGQDYGGEAVFRVFLYSLPGCAFVLAPVLSALLRGRGIQFAAALVAVCAAISMSAQAYFGNWFTNIVTAAEVQAADMLLAGGDYPAYITPLVPVWPERSTAKYVDYAQFADYYDHSMMFQEEFLHSAFDTDAEYQRFMSAVESRTDASMYLVLSEQMAFYGMYFGLFPYEAVSNLREHVADDPRWRRIQDDAGVAVYLYRVEIG
jgi:hypothetical protein